MSDCVGLKLGNYRIVRLLGQGGFAQVYLGEHIYLKTPAAIKVLNMQLANDALTSFLREARTIARLDHPHIIRVLEFGIEEITPFLVMSYAEKGTLRQRYPRKSILPWTEIVSYTKQIADALQYAHNQGVIHRDVKPENMLLRQNNSLQLSDFGLAVIAQSMNAYPSAIGTHAGTTTYMAPEQIQGRPERASDQYALGIVVYEWFCGTWPFTGSEREITVQQLYTLPPSMHTKVPGITPEIENVVMKALAKEPQQRFATVQEFAQALERACALAISQNIHKISLATSPISFEDVNAIPLFPPEVVSHSSSEEPTQKIPAFVRESEDAISSVNLSLSEAIFTDQSRISPPSLNPDSISLQLSPQLQARDQQSMLPRIQALPPHTPQANFIPARDFSQGAQPVTPQTERMSQETRIQTTRAEAQQRSIIIVLSIAILIALSLMMGILAWPRLTQDKQAIPMTQKTAIPVGQSDASTPGISPTPGVNKAATTTPTGSASQPGTVPTQQAAITPGVTPTIQSGTTPITTTVPTATATPIPPLSVAITSAPSSAIGGTIITIETKANQGGVTIALNGKVRRFGQQIADSQGVAIFQIRVPIKARFIILTATAIDQNGNQAASSSWTIAVT